MANEVRRSLGEDAINCFSKNVNINQISLICTLGAGSFAQVYLVKKEEQECDMGG